MVTPRRPGRFGRVILVLSSRRRRSTFSHRRVAYGEGLGEAAAPSLWTPIPNLAILPVLQANHSPSEEEHPWQTSQPWLMKIA